MVPSQLRSRVHAGVAALLLSALVLSACKQPASATATPTKIPPAATATKGQDVAPADTNTPEPPAPTADTSILFQDDFSDATSGWPTNQADQTTAGYQTGGIYRLDISAVGNLMVAARPGAFSDFSLETVVTGAGGAGGRARYGVAFRQLTPDNFYGFFISPSIQGYVVAKRLLGQWTVLAEGTNTAIPTTPDPVTLRIDAQGPNLAFSINGTGLVSLVDAEFSAGDVGYILETQDASSARLDADSIIIRRFNADTVPPAPTAAPVVEGASATPDPNATATPVPPTVRPIGSVQPPPATQALPSTQAIEATLVGAGTALAATANAAATQACALLGCP